MGAAVSVLLALIATIDFLSISIFCLGIKNIDSFRLLLGIATNNSNAVLVYIHNTYIFIENSLKNSKSHSVKL